MGMELTQGVQQALLERQIAAKIPLQDFPDGPVVDRFSALDLAQAIEFEVNRAAIVGFQKIRLDCSRDDAMRLATFLRRAVSAGV
jgi:hypothetical protein